MNRGAWVIGLHIMQVRISAQFIIIKHNSLIISSLVNDQKNNKWFIRLNSPKLLTFTFSFIMTYFNILMKKAVYENE